MVFLPCFFVLLALEYVRHLSTDSHTSDVLTAAPLSLWWMSEDLSSMSLLWMSFVRDVRLLWEDGAALARMVRQIPFSKLLGEI